MDAVDRTEEKTINTKFLWIGLMLVGALLLAGCIAEARVGALQTESQSVELGDEASVRVEINMGAGDLKLTGGAEKLLEADFTYNVAKLKPEVEYADGTLVVRQPDVKGLPALRGITDFRNEWNLHLYDKTPIDLRVEVGAGESTVDLSGDWVRDLDVTIDAGMGEITVRLPKDVGARVAVDAGVGTIDTSGLTQDGDAYTNAAYGVSTVTLQVNVKAGVGQINLAVAE